MFLEILKRRKIAYVGSVCVFLYVALFAVCSFAAEGGAVSTFNARQQSQSQAAGNLGAGAATGPGSDLARIASPKKTTTFTGFPAGTLPGDVAGGTSAGATPGIPGNVVLLGGNDPLLPVIGAALIGTRLNRICAIADHAGYSLTQQRHVTNAIDSAYAYNLMNGKRKLATLYFDHSMKLLFVQ